MRYFIALTFKKENIDEIIKIQKNIENEIKERNIKYTKVNPKNIHLTLKYIGEFNHIIQLKELIDKIKIKIPKTIKISGINTFNGRIIFLDVEHKYQKTLNEINNLINKHINTQEEKYHAHITLFRLKNMKYTPRQTPTKLNIGVEELVLFNSTLTYKGPIYEKIYSAKI